MVDLQECRREIDEIDDKILRLFEKKNAGLRGCGRI